jgi:4-alpha-glucanotransferase
MPLSTRRGGVLAHPTSLPGRFGIGDLGPAAYEFLDYLAEAGQTLWQVLPIGPTGYGNSPYASPSAFAGNPMLIAVEPLMRDGLLEQTDVADLAGLPSDRVDFARLLPAKRRALQIAFHRARHTDNGDLSESVKTFRQEQAGWLNDYALFAALGEHRNCVWTDWEPPLRNRDPAALDGARSSLAETVELHVFVQYLFHTQWTALRRRASELGILIVGDIPIFVAHDSADVWSRPDLFKLDENGRPLVVAGVPPDYFSARGQLWGNPLYDWDAMARQGYGWWIDRFKHLLRLVDIVRVDHFRGFQAAWEVEAGATTAVDGRWAPGPGRAVFDAMARAIGGPVPVIAEDLGMITDDVRQLLADLGYPGMKVLQFAFGGDADNVYLPHAYRDTNCVVYTGTHDNDTTRGWYEAADEPLREHVQRYLARRHGDDVVIHLMRLAYSSVASTALVPLQDVLGLGSEARMNTPGAAEGNWEWRATSQQLTSDAAHRLSELSRLYGR